MGPFERELWFGIIIAMLTVTLAIAIIEALELLITDPEELKGHGVNSHIG